MLNNLRVCCAGSVHYPLRLLQGALVNGRVVSNKAIKLFVANNMSNAGMEKRRKGGEVFRVAGVDEVKES
jgi:hypothetical protein